MYVDYREKNKKNVFFIGSDVRFSLILGVKKEVFNVIFSILVLRCKLV